MALARHHRRSGRSTGSGLTRIIGAAGLGASLLLGACTEEIHHGYQMSEQAQSQIQNGSSREQVLLVLGQPSTVSTLDNEAFYYISQTRSRPVAFMNTSTTDQRIYAVYFDKDGRVKDIANYGMQDGKIFDFIARKTKTGGQDINLISQIMKAGAANPFGGLGQ